jgi:deazaflavin-dependent oxidoreductase (nitroreductase family)
VSERVVRKHGIESPFKGEANMAHLKTDKPKHDLPPGLSQPALRALSAAGYTHLEQFTTIKEADLLELHGMGPKAIGLIRSALNAKGLSFADPGSKREISAANEQVFDSPTDWVRSHIRAYVASDGKEGHQWRGLPTLLLTTRGRKSGKLRRTALIYGRDGKNYLLVASNGGAPNHPHWYLNLVEDPEVELQVGAEKFAARARTASSKEKPRRWQLMVKIFPQYNNYQAKAGREIPLVIVEPA